MRAVSRAHVNLRYSALLVCIRYHPLDRERRCESLVKLADRFSKVRHGRFHCPSIKRRKFLTRSYSVRLTSFLVFSHGRRTLISLFLSSCYFSYFLVHVSFVRSLYLPRFQVSIVKLLRQRGKPRITGMGIMACARVKKAKQLNKQVRRRKRERGRDG